MQLGGPACGMWWRLGEGNQRKVPRNAYSVGDGCMLGANPSKAAAAAREGSACIAFMARSDGARRLRTGEESCAAAN